MMNLIEASPGPSSVAQAASGGNDASETGPARGTTQTSAAAGDSIARGASAYGSAAAAGFAYAELAGGGRNPRVDPQSGAFGSDRDEALAARFGPQFSLIRAALPAALQAQFLAQMTAAYDAADGAQPAVRPNGTTLSEHDLATLIAAGTSGKDQAAAPALVSRLSHDVARCGSAAVAQALALAHERTAFAAAGDAPAARADKRVTRRDDAEQRQRRERGYEPRDPPSKPGDATIPDGGNAIYTIEDIIEFGDSTIATHRMLSPSPNIERTAQ